MRFNKRFTQNWDQRCMTRQITLTQKILTLSTSLSVFSSFALQPFRVPPDTFHWLQSCEFELADIWLQDIKIESSPNCWIYSFYDDCCRSESGALWEILASGICASAFMPLLVKSRLEDRPNNPSRCCSRIRLRSVNQQKGTALMIQRCECLLMEKSSSPPSRKPKPKIKAHVLNAVQELVRVDILQWWFRHLTLKRAAEPK